MSNREHAKPSLSALSFILRHKELWPEGFNWNYQSCSNCAMGLAHAVWSKQVPEHDLMSMKEAFGISDSDGQRIFLKAAEGYHYVTPERIADLIDAI